MNIKKILATLVSVIALLVSFDTTVKAASPLPPQSLPINNVFTVPKGANSYVDGNAVIITKDSKSQIGSIFSTNINKLDMTQSFHAEMYVYLGDKAGAAADGMTFVMHADDTIIDKFTAGVGDQLGVYAKVNATGGGFIMQQYVKNSFAVEFDTYYNGDGMDKQVLKNDDRGHVAYSFPSSSNYYVIKSSKIDSLIHKGLYYPSDYLSNGKWHLFSVDWNVDTKKLSYKFDDAPTVDVPIDPMTTFRTNSVYWGFTGSTGALSQESKVAFKQIPGLVNVRSSMTVTKDGKDITNTGISGTDEKVLVEYELKYLGGKQNMMNPKFTLRLAEQGINFKPGTLTVNGVKVVDNYFTGRDLTYSLPNDLSLSNDTFKISFEATPAIFEDRDVIASMKYSMSSDNYFGNDEQTQFPISRVKIVKSSDFENQSWLINEINRQLAPKKIDVDVYEQDLAKIEKIDLTTTPIVNGEYIPKTIDSLINLNYLRLANQKLSGVLPEEMGNLSKLTYLSIYGNTFDSEIPNSIGKLDKLTLLAFSDSNLKGTVPASIGSLPNLSQIYLDGNKLSGQLPDFKENMYRIDVKGNQLTYNLATIPSFFTSAEKKAYTQTFIQGLKLTGNSNVSSENEQIKPFDELDKGYFDLKATAGVQAVSLVDEHSYTIKDSVEGTIYYRGKRDTKITIPYKKGISYTVILDEADKNPNNVFIVLGKERELKFSEIPVSIRLKMKLGSGKQPVIPEGKLAIFDNRENKKWKLSMTPSELTQGQMKLQGEYSYVGKDGISHPIINGQKFLLETGESDSVNEVIQVSNSLGNNYGLNYTAYLSNHIGNYQGNVIWTLEDAP